MFWHQRAKNGEVGMLWWVLGVAVVGVVVVRRVRGEPLNARDLWAAPVVLTCLGVGRFVQLDPGPAQLGWVVAASLAGLAFGLVRGGVVVVFERHGHLWQRYTWHAFAVAASSALILAGFDLVATRLGAHPEARPVTLAVGVSFLGEALAVTLRAMRLGIPFAPQRTRQRLGR
jgi:hypothetical protein